MKKIMFIAMMSFIMMSGICQSHENLFDTIFNAVSHDLGFDKMNVEIQIRDAHFCTHIKSTDEPAASAEHLRKNKYLIYIYFNLDHDRLVRAVIHELVHVNQMQSGRMFVKRDCIIYNGFSYNKTMPYNERPFERDAIKKSDELFNKYFTK
jgi:hypothetical protein